MIDVLPQLVIPSATLVVGMAFSWKVRNEILKRAGNKSELSGRTDRPLEAGHLLHTRDDNYNDANNGVLGTDIEHAIFHLRHRRKAHITGLTEYQNEWSVNEIMKRVFRFDIGKFGSVQDHKQDFEQAHSDWEDNGY